MNFFKRGEEQFPKVAATPGVNVKNDIDEGKFALIKSQNKEFIGQKEIRRASEILSHYKRGKTNLEERIVKDEMWWKIRHWEVIKSKKDSTPAPSSAWLFNTILNKHADAMDNFPEPCALPREKSDEKSATVLSSILPVVLENNDFEDTYSRNWWEKLKHGTAAYGIFWNNEKENGLGDIDIRDIDLLKLFWEPGITDIQKSKNLFIVELCDRDSLERMYPEHKGKIAGNVIDVKEYIYDDSVDNSDKVVVVDWYYKVKSSSGKTVVHYVKFVGDVVLYASENEEAYRERGFYDHGKYPVILDVLFPEKGTPVGFGYVSVCRDPQLYIDKLSANILESALMSTKKRFFVSSSTAINEDEFVDWSKPLVHVEGEISDARIKEITLAPMSPIYANLVQMKVDEMKDTSGNRDVNSGGTGSGVTAASAIVALQESGNKSSRDMISASYRKYVGVCKTIIELMRQFYDEIRSFRVVGKGTLGYEFVEFSNAQLKEENIGVGADGEALYRVPVFDIKIKAQRKNPFSRAEQNERAKELYRLGLFNPERSQEALGALEMMDFEGIEKVREYISQGQTLLNTVEKMAERLTSLETMLKGGGGVDVPPVLDVKKGSGI
jgi:hypothetical protein